jgi:hypothetical protein
MGDHGKPTHSGGMSYARSVFLSRLAPDEWRCRRYLEANLGFCPTDREVLLYRYALTQMFSIKEALGMMLTEPPTVNPAGRLNVPAGEEQPRFTMSCRGILQAGLGAVFITFTDYDDSHGVFRFCLGGGKEVSFVQVENGSAHGRIPGRPKPLNFNGREDSAEQVVVDLIAAMPSVPQMWRTLLGSSSEVTPEPESDPISDPEDEISPLPELAPVNQLAAVVDRQPGLSYLLDPSDGHRPAC